MGELQMYQGYVHGAQRWGKPFLLSGVTLGDPRNQEKGGELSCKDTGLERHFHTLTSVVLIPSQVRGVNSILRVKRLRKMKSST